MLNTRRAELRESGIVDHDAETGYRLTEAGTDFLQCLLPLHDWAETWAGR